MGWCVYSELQCFWGGVKMYLKNCLGAMIIGLLAGTATAHATGITFKDGDKYVKLGGRIQLQYYRYDPKIGESTDELKFRRLRPFIEGSVHKDWKGIIQVDFGQAEDDNEVSVKNAYVEYMGLESLGMRIGHANFPFSRELWTSSKRQQLVERTFVGDHNYGTPDRNLGVFLKGQGAGKKLTWAAALASAAVDPDASKLDFDTPINRKDDFNQGWMVGGRLDFHPLGYLKFAQGNFARETKITFGVSAFAWGNDDDNNTYTDANGNAIDPDKPDVDNATGFELSGALRWAGLSVDVQYNLFNTETIDPNFDGGIYRNGESDLVNYAIEGGYMIVPGKFELVAAYESQDADGYAKTWSRSSLGANYFFAQHDIKLQFTYRMGENLDGVQGVDADEAFLQMQYVF